MCDSAELCLYILMSVLLHFFSRHFVTNTSLYRKGFHISYILIKTERKAQRITSTNVPCNISRVQQAADSECAQFRMLHNSSETSLYFSFCALLVRPRFKPGCLTSLSPFLCFPVCFLTTGGGHSVHEWRFVQSNATIDVNVKASLFSYCLVWIITNRLKICLVC